MHLEGRYHQYKAQTDYVVRFLVESASWLNATPSQPFSAQRSYTVETVSQLEYMAAQVCRSRSVKIPQAVVNKLNAAIRLREDFARLHRRSLDDKEQKKNETHQHFIDVLKRIRLLMSEAMQRHTLVRDPSFDDRPNADEQACSNQPFHLAASHDAGQAPASESEEEETQDVTFHDAGQAPGSESEEEETQDVTSHDAGQAPELQSGDKEAEDAFALWCFLMDSADVREHIHEVWSKYYNGDNMLSAVSEVTHNAIIMMAKKEATFVDRWPRFTRYDDVLGFFNFKWYTTAEGTFVTRRNEVTNPNATDMETSDLDLKLQLLLAIPAYRIASDFCQLSLIRRRRLVVTRSYETNLNSAPKCHPFAKILYNILPDIEGIAKCSEEEQEDMCLDSFTQGLVELYRTCAISSLTVLSIQIYMEIFTCLGEKGYKRSSVWLRLRGNEMTAAAKRHLDFLRLNTGNKFPEVERTLLTTVQRRIETFVHADGFGQLRAAHSTAEMFHLFSSMPVLCGHFMYINRAMLHLDGVEQCNSSRAVLIMSYLLEGARACGFETLWPDMDFVLGQQRTRPIVLGVGPSSTPLFSLANHYCISLGADPIAKNRKKDQGQRWLRSILPSDYDIQKSGRKLDLSSPLMVELACDIRDPLSAVEAALTRLALQRDAAKDNQAVSNASQPTHVKDKSTVELLQILLELLVADEFNQNFDFLAFWENCSVLTKACIEAVPNTLCIHRRKTQQPAEIVLNLFLEAAFIESGARMRKPEDAMLSKVGRALDERLLGMDRDKHIENAKKNSSNYIMEGAKPRNLYPRQQYQDHTIIPKEVVVVMLGTCQREFRYYWIHGLTFTWRWIVSNTLSNTYT